MSRIIIKNVSKSLTESSLKEVLQNRLAESNVNNITDIKLIKKEHNTHGYAFVGFELESSACKAIQILDNSYLENSKVSAEIALCKNDPSRPKSYKDRQEEFKRRQKEKDDYVKLCQMKSKLQKAGNNNFLLRKLLTKFKKEPQFMEYLRITLNNSPILEKLDSQLLSGSERKEESEEGENKNDSGISEEEKDVMPGNLKEQQEKLSAELSRAQLWSSIIGNSQQFNSKVDES